MTKWDNLSKFVFLSIKEKYFSEHKFKNIIFVFFTGPGGRNNNNDVVDDQNLEVMTSESEDSNKSSALSSPSSSNAPAIPSHPGCRGGHQMVINSDNQVSVFFLIKYGILGVFFAILALPMHPLFQGTHYVY